MKVVISASAPREMADAASLVSDGAFRYGYTSNPGDGVRYCDGVRQKVWTGQYAATRAAAYYAGVMRCYWENGTGAARKALGEWAATDPQLHELYVQLWRGDGFSRTVRQEWDEGYEDARYKIAAS